MLQRAGRLDEAEPLMREALAIRREVLGPTDPDVASTLNNLGMILRNKGDLTNAAPMLREALDLRRQKLGNDHPDVVIQTVNVALRARGSRRPRGSEKHAREALATRRRILGPEHPAMANTLRVLGRCAGRRGRLRRRRAAVPRSRSRSRARASASSTRRRRDSSPVSAGFTCVPATTRRPSRCCATSLAIQRKALGVDNEATRTTLTSLARALERPGRLRCRGGRGARGDCQLPETGQSAADCRPARRARRIARSSGGSLSRRPPPCSRRATCSRSSSRRRSGCRRTSASLLGAALAGQQKYAEAEPLLISGYEGLRDTSGSPRSRLRKSIERLVAFYPTAGRPAEAAPWRARLQAIAADRFPP